MNGESASGECHLRGRRRPGRSPIDVATTADAAETPIGGHVRFRYVGRHSLENYPTFDTYHPLKYACSAEADGAVATFSLQKFKKRTLFGTGESFDLEFLFMSEKNTCTWTKWNVLLGASASCGQLEVDAWFDRMYGTIAMVPRVADESGCTK